MSSYTIRIENNTYSTPEVRHIVLTNCQWLFTQHLYNGQPIAPDGGVAQGMVEPTPGSLTYEGTLTVHYYYMPPGPGGADVNVRFGVVDLGMGLVPFIGADATSQRLELDWEIITHGGNDFIGILSIDQS